MKNLQFTRIFVGLSGGVDSAVSAALLKQAGADVTGVFIKGWYPPGMPCTWAADRRDAMRVAAHLHIPFHTLDASAEYKNGVIEYLLAEYAAGRTPNPDVMCNREVKFGAFYTYARNHGADAIATGHYRASSKDQSYFLWAVPKDALEHTVFPVGNMKKESVRTIARRLKLPVAEKKDSQGVCFLGSISVDEFLRSEFGVTPGRAVDEDGNTIGTHDGVLLYTLGERIALHDPSSAGPWFVLAKQISENTLVVGKSRTGKNQPPQTEIHFAHENWLGTPDRVMEAQYRYRGPRISGRVDGNRFIALSSLPEIPTPGQSIAFYNGGELIGGGIIEK